MKQRFTLRMDHIACQILKPWRLLAAIGLVFILPQLGQAASYTATLAAGSVAWSGITWSPAGPPVAGDNITFTVSNATTDLTGVPATAFGTLTFNNTSGVSRTVIMTVASGTSFTSTTLSGTTNPMNLTIAGAAFICPTVRLTAASASTINYSTFGWGASNALTVNVDGANHTLANNSGAAHGLLTINNLHASTARQLTLTNSSTATTFTKVVLTSAGGALTVLQGTNPIKTTTAANTVTVEGTGTFGANNMAFASGTALNLTAIGGNLTFNGMPASPVNMDVTLSADGSARNVSLRNPSSGGFRNVVVNANATWTPDNNAVNVSGNLTGAGSLNSSVAVSVAGNVNLTSNLTMSNVTLNVTGTTTLGGTMTLAGGTTTFGGAVNITGNVTASSSSINVNGSNNFTIGGNYSGTSGTLTVTGGLSVTGTLTTTTTGSFNITGPMSVTGTMNNQGSGTLTVGGNATFGTNLTRVGGNITLGRDLSVVGTFSVSSSPTITLNGSGAQSISYGAGTPALTTINITNTTGPISWSGSASISTNLTNATSGGLTFSTGTITFTSNGISGTISGNSLITFNNLTGTRIGGSPAYNINCDVTVNGTFTGNGSANFNFTFVKNATNTPRTLTFKGTFNRGGSQDFSCATFTTAGNLFHNVIFEGAAVDLNAGALFPRVTGTGAGAGASHGIDIYFRAPLGGQTVTGASASTGNTWRNFYVDGSTTGDVIWNYYANNTITGNFINNATADFTTPAGNKAGSGNNSDRFMFTGAGTHTIGTSGGAVIELNQLSSVNGATVQLLQDLTINKAGGGGSSVFDQRAFGIDATSFFDINGKTLIFNSNGTNSMEMIFARSSGGSWTNTASGTVYFKTATTVPNTISVSGNETFYNLRIAGTNGVTISGGSSRTLTIAGTLTLEAAFVASGTTALAIGNGSKVIRNAGGSLSGGGSIVYPTGSNFYDLVYNSASTVAAGAEWVNAVNVRHLTIGPESGGANATGVTLAAIGSRSISGNLILNSGAASALNITGSGLPMATSGSTVYRYSTGTVSQAPTYPATINLFYGGNLTTGAELPAGAQANKLNNLTIDPGSSNTVTLASSANVGGNLLISTGTANLAAFTANRQTSGGSLTLAANTSLIIGGTNTFPSNYTSVSLATPASTVDYNGTTQTIGIQNYGNLSISGVRGASNVTIPAGTIDINGAFTASTTFSSGAYLVDPANVINFSGANGQNIPEFNYQTLTSSNNNRTLTGVIGVAVAFAPGSGTYTTTASTLDYNGTSAQTVIAFLYNNLVVSGSRGVNNVTFANSGSVSVAGSLTLTASFGGGGYVMTGSTISYAGATQAVVPIPTVGYNNLTIAQTSGNATASNDLLVNGTFSITGGKLILNGNDLTIGASGSATVSSPSGTQMIDLGGTGSVIKEFASPAAASFVWPIGTGSSYSPASVSNLTATGSGSIAVQLFNTNSPNVADPSVAMDRYWSVAVAGLTISNTNASFTYLVGDVVGTEGSYVARRFNGGIWNNDGASISSRVITATGITALNGEWTAGESIAFASVSVFYSLGGDWNTPASWSQSGFGGPAAVSVPTSSDLVQIGDGKTITVGGYAITASSLQLQPTGILQFDDVPSGINSLGSVTGSGILRFSNSTSTTPTFPGGSFSTFVGGSGGTVEYTGTGSYTIPNQATYNRLTFSGTGTKNVGSSILVNGQLTVNSGGVMGAVADLTLKGTVTVDGTVNQTAGTTLFNTGAAQTMNGAPTSCIFNNIELTAGTNLMNSISFGLRGNLVNSSNATTALECSAGTITFLGNTSQAINGGGTGRLQLSGLTINGTSRLTTGYSLEVTGDITNSSSGVSGVSFNQTSGTLTINGGTTQTFGGVGTGTWTVNELVLSGTTTLASTANMLITTNFTNNSTLATALDASGGSIGFLGTASTISGLGTGTINFYNLDINGAAKLTTSKGLRLRNNLNNNSTGQGGISMSVNNVEFEFNGATPQVVGGSGTGTLVFDDFIVLPNASVTASSNIEILGDFTNSSIGQSGISFVQSGGTTFFSGASIQTIAGAGSGTVTFNDLTISNTPSRINVSSSFSILGDFTNNSDGISSFAFSATVGTITFNGTSAQTMGGAGTGTIAFNNMAIGTAARINTTTNFTLAGNLTNNSAGIGSPALAFNATAGTLTFNGASDQNINGSGIGGIQLASIVISSTPSRVVASQSFSISGTWNNSSNGRSGNSFTSSATVTFNGVGSQSVTGSGTGTNIMTNASIASGTRVQSTLAFTFNGNFTNGSNGVGGYSWDNSSRFTFNGGTTQSITGSGTGVIRFTGITINAGTRVNCDQNLENQTSSMTFNGSGLGSPALVFNQTVGQVTVSLSGGGQNMGGTGTGGVVFYDLTLNSGAPGTYGLNKSFNVTNTLTVLAGSGNFTLGSTTADLTINTQDLLLSGSNASGGFATASPSGSNRNHTINVAGNVTVSGICSFSTTATNGGFMALTTINLDGSNRTISGAGQSVVNWAKVNLTGSYTNTATGDNLNIGTDNALISDGFGGSGSWTQGTNGKVNFNLQDSEWTLPGGNFVATATGNTVTFNATTTGSRLLPVSTFHNLTINHSGSPTNTYTNTGALTVNGNLILTAGTLNMGNRDLYIGGTTTWTGTLSVTDNTVTLASAGAQSLPGLSYLNVVKSGTGTATLLGNTTVRNSLGLGAGTLATGGFNLNLGVTAGDVIDISRAVGTISSAPVFVPGVIYNYTYNPTASATVTLGNEMLPASNTTDLHNLTINHTGSPLSSIVADRNLTINGVLTLTAGKLNVSSRVLTFNGTSIARSSGTLVTNGGASGTELVFGTNGSSMAFPAGSFDSNPSSVKNITQSRVGNVSFSDQDINVSGAINFTADGFLNTGASKFSLGTTGVVTNETNARYVRGRMESVRDVSLPTSTIDFGGMGVKMRNYTQSLGSSLTVLRIAGVVEAISPGNSPGLSGNSSARTRWEVTNVTTQPTAGVELELTWFGDNDNVGGCGSCAVGRMAIYTRPDASSPWTRLRNGDVYMNADAGSDLRKLYVVARHFSDFTPGYEAAPLPVSLAQFSGATTTSGVQLQWTTASERNANRFEIQRSINGQEFVTIGSTKAIGNSSVIRRYAYLDAGQAGGVYYRLRTVDNDNSAELSNVIFVEATNGERRLSVYPNPVKGEFKLNVSGWDVRQAVSAMLIGADGKMVWGGFVTPADAERHINGMLSVLPSGMYIFKLTDGKGSQMTKVVKE